MTQMMLSVPFTEFELPAGLNDLEASIDQQIRSFLDGENDGHELLVGLHGDVIDEPIPARLIALLRG
jgi:hypothetical protein